MPGGFRARPILLWGRHPLHRANGIRSKSPGFKQTGQVGRRHARVFEIAYSYIRSRIAEMEAHRDYFDHHSIHLHVPAGATPKDERQSEASPMALALFSLYLATGGAGRYRHDRRVDPDRKGAAHRRGERKTIAARRVGIHHLILPADNQKRFRRAA